MSMSRAGGAVADSGDGMPQSAIDAGEHLAAVSRYTEAAPTVAEAACFGFRDEGGAPTVDPTLSSNLSSGGFVLDQNRPTGIHMANTTDFDFNAGGKLKKLSDRVGEHLTEWDELGALPPLASIGAPPLPLGLPLLPGQRHCLAVTALGRYCPAAAIEHGMASDPRVALRAIEALEPEPDEGGVSDGSSLGLDDSDDDDDEFMAAYRAERMEAMKAAQACRGPRHDIPNAGTVALLHPLSL